MTHPLMSRRSILLPVTCCLAVVMILALGAPALVRACTLCTGMGPPLMKEISDAKLVVFGKILDARLGPDGIQGTSEFSVECILRGDAGNVKNQRLVLPRYVPPVPGMKYLIFLDVVNGQVDPYRSISCTTDRLVQYLQKMPAITGAGTAKERQARLRYTFDYFQDAEPELAADAYKEWALAGNLDVAALAAKLDPDKLRRWLLDPKTPSHCLSLYAYLLGSCGKPADLELLKKLAVSPPDARYRSALDGILCGMERQQAADTWKVARTLASDEQRTFTERYAVLRFVRFVRDVRQPSPPPEVNSTLELMLSQPDMIDLAIEQMRLMHCWDQQQRIFALYDSGSASIPITKRAIIRFALDCPGEQAQQFLSKVRKKEPETVRDLEEVRLLNQKP